MGIIGQVYDWNKSFSEDREITERLPHANFFVYSPLFLKIKLKNLEFFGVRDLSEIPNCFDGMIRKMVELIFL